MRRGNEPDRDSRRLRAAEQWRAEHPDGIIVGSYIRSNGHGKQVSIEMAPSGWLNLMIRTVNRGEVGLGHVLGLDQIEGLLPILAEARDLLDREVVELDATIQRMK